MPSDRTRGNGHKLNRRKCHFNMWKTFPVRTVTRGNRLPRAAVVSWSCSECNWTQPEQPALSRVGANDLQSSLPTSATLWFCEYEEKKLFYTVRKHKILILFQMLIMFGFFSSSQIKIKTKLWNTSFWSSECFRLTKYAALYSYRTWYIDLTKCFNTFSLETLMKVAGPVQHFYLLSSYINLSVGNCSPCS